MTFLKKNKSRQTNVIVLVPVSSIYLLLSASSQVDLNAQYDSCSKILNLQLRFTEILL